MNENNGVMRIPRFSGKKEDFPMWLSQFRAICTVKGVGECFDNNWKIQLPAKESTVLDETNATEKKQIEAKKKNNMAFSYATLAMDAPKLLVMLESSKSADWPSGRPDILMGKLMKKFKPTDTLAVAEQTKKLMKLKLGKDQDPDELGNEIAALESQYGSILAEKEKVAAVVNAAGAIYADTILQEAKNLDAKGETTTADALIEAMSERFRISCGGNSDESHKEDIGDKETKLVAGDYFPGTCHNCGKKGHKSVDCPKPRLGFSGTCNLCNRRGHREKDCWEKEENASKRPKGWKSRLGDKQEGSNVGVELMIACVEVGTIDDESTKGKLTCITAGSGKNELTCMMAGSEKKESTCMMAGDSEKKESTCMMAGDGKNESTCKVAGDYKCLTCIMAGNAHTEKMCVNFTGESTDLKIGAAKTEKFEQGRLSEGVKSAPRFSVGLERFENFNYCAAESGNVLL